MTAQIEQPKGRVPAGKRSVALGGADIGRCLTRLHHDRFTEAISVVDEVAERRAQAGMEHEQNVLNAIFELFGNRVTRINPFDDRYAATKTALDSGVDFIVGGRIASADAALVGAPDLLVRHDDGYVAVEVKGHFVLGTSGYRCATTPLSNLQDHASVQTMDATAEEEDDGPQAPRFRGSRKRDLYQTAHYWRILETLNHATSRPYGGVIGTEEPLSCAWVDFTVGEPSILTKTSNFTTDALDALRSGASSPQRPSVAPYWRGECRGCSWQELCITELIANEDPTLIGGIGPETRAELALAGITTIPGVADLSPDTGLLVEAEPILIARAHTSGRLLRRHHSENAVDVPQPARQVDFDIETYHGRIYLAGFLETVGQETRFDPISDWSGNEASERDLVEELFGRLASYGDDDTQVFYWTRYEPTTLTEAGDRWDLGIPGSPSIDAWFNRHAVDLHRWTKDRFVSGSGYGLKSIAPQCGFHWRDDDPGGQQSEIWFEEMVAGNSSMQLRLLAYNEDDVAAQLAIRRWIIEQDAGHGPGTAIPSALAWPHA